MEYRFFQLNHENCIIHYPEKPNGFGVMIIGNEDGYVRDGESSWLRKNSRMKILRQLLSEGYTIFYSNLTGKHMGNPHAYKLAESLYEYIKRTEILNERIHIISEGMGASIVCHLLKQKIHSTRSILFINPEFSLTQSREIIKDQPFLYKRFLLDVAKAYQIDVKECEQFIINLHEEKVKIPCPFKIVHILNNGIKDPDWVKWYSINLQILDGNLHVLLPEKNMDIIKQALDIFKLAESPL